MTSLPTLSAALIAFAAFWAWARRASLSAFTSAKAARKAVGADGIVPGAQAIRLDADGDRVVLLIHGFGDTPQTLGYLAQFLWEGGYSVRAPLLPGHGRTIDDFAASGFEEWREAVRRELSLLTKEFPHVSVAGLSMGGALGAIVAAERADIEHLILLAPFLGMRAPIRFVALVHGIWALFAPYAGARGDKSVHDPAEKNRSLAYGLFTPRLLHELALTVRHARAALPRLSVPVLMIQSETDNRIAPEIARDAFARIGSPQKTLVWVRGCGHVITVDFCRETVFRAIAEWLEERAASLAPRTPARLG